MAFVNLLDWRERERVRSGHALIRVAGMVCLLAASVSGAGWYVAHGYLVDQQERNAKIRTEISDAEQRLGEVRGIEQKRSLLIQRMNVIRRLQERRPQIVHVFHEVVARMPDGLYLTSLELLDGDLTLEGRARSKSRVSDYMRNLSDSPWLTRAELEVIERSGGNRADRFTIDLEQSIPSEEDTTGTGHAGGAGGADGGERS